MTLRNVGLLALVIAATAACKRAEDRVHSGPAPVAQGSNAPDDPWSAREPKRDPLAHPLFWKLEKDGHTSYLLGTMHVGVDPHARLPDVVWQKLDEAKAFAMEVDLAEAGKLDMTRKDSITLRDELGEAYWNKLEDAIGRAEAQRVLKMKPMIPAALLGMRGLPRTAAMDGALYARAVRRHERVVVLESLDSELAVLDKWMNARAVKDMLDDLPGVEQRSQDMLAAYIAGDDAKILALQQRERQDWKRTGRPEQEYDAQMEDLLFKRNASWLPAIEKLHAEGGGFIAIGAAHAVGPRSVLDLLEKKGFRITRVVP
jgi:hypothetical protein